MDNLLLADCSDIAGPLPCASLNQLSFSYTVQSFGAFGHKKADFNPTLKSYCFISSVNDFELRIALSLHGKTDIHGRFVLKNIQHKIEIEYEFGGEMSQWYHYESTSQPAKPEVKPYSPFFMGFESSGKLSLKGNDYLNLSQAHRIIYSHDRDDFEISLTSPFFYQDKHNNYLADPVDITYMVASLKEPDIRLYVGKYYVRR